MLNPKLEMVTSGGAGFDHINLADLNACGTKYCNTPGAVAGPTAELTATFILSLLRQTHKADMVVRNGNWGRDGRIVDRGEMKPSRSPRNCVLGILGLGTIGKMVAHRMRAVSNLHLLAIIRFLLTGDTSSLA